MTDEKTSLKILHVLDHSLPIHTGYTFRTRYIFQSQLKRGWIPVAVTSPKHEKSWKGEWLPQESILGVRYYRTGPVDEGMTPVSELRLVNALAGKIREVARAEKPDLLHAHSPILNALAALYAGRKLGIPVVYEIRSFWEDAAVDHGTYPVGSWKYRLVRSTETWLCRTIGSVVVICGGLKQDLVKRGILPEKIAIVGNGVNVEDFQQQVVDEALRRTWGLEGKKIIGFIGSFYHYEGLDLLLEAFSCLSKARPDVALLLVGEGNEEPKLRRQVEHLGLGEKVVMPGRVPHDRIPGIYSMIDILAYPRYRMRLTELVTPLKPLEAMAMGKALVASDVGGHRELIRHGHTGILFTPGDAPSLARALESLLGDEEKRKELESNGASWVRGERTWAITTSIYSDVYAAVLGRSGPRNPVNHSFRAGHSG
jgi:PEP-CTERM/exosortase A-associated glycosyltransferase